MTEHPAPEETPHSRMDSQPAPAFIPRESAAGGTTGAPHDHLRAVNPGLYDELRAIAARALRGEARTTAPGTTSLVHEIWLRLARSDRSPVNDQQHLLALASLIARRALVDDARMKSAQRRSAGTPSLPLPENLEAAPADPASVLAIDELLTRLAERHPRQAKALEMRIFGGISPDHIAIALDISPTQAKRDVAFARAWLVAATTGEGGAAAAESADIRVESLDP